MFVKRLEELVQLVKECVYTTHEGVIEEESALQLAHSLLHDTEEAKGIVYVIGNGGSAGIASHFCTDLLKALGIPASTLVDSNLLTCIGNDLGYENVFSKPLQTLMHSQDLLVAISSSGKSPNIINAADVAREKGAKVITLSGFANNNPLRTKGDLNFWLKASDYGLVETGHFSLLHTIVDSWKDRKMASYKSLLQSMMTHAH
ncbi:MAG: SIS domain-containing protein [Chlamydiales bacterium]|nr:SIS domain-containing protein [Chlamydiales bacterium]